MTLSTLAKKPVLKKDQLGKARPKEAKANKPDAAGKAKPKEDDLDDTGVMKVKIGRKGNEFVKPGCKKYRPESASYTTQVLHRLDQIKHPKAKKAAKAKKSDKTNAEIELEEIELNGIEVIKGLDEYYEKVRVDGRRYRTNKLSLIRSSSLRRSRSSHSSRWRKTTLMSSKPSRRKSPNILSRTCRSTWSLDNTSFIYLTSVLHHRSF